MTTSHASTGRSDPTEDELPNAIAVIGMGCKFPGADSVDEYWRLLDSGLSMVTEPPPDRFPTRHHPRSNDKSVFFGNFLNDIASFDNRFFKKSGREAASMDPQQRLLLEVAYQALESSGYFGPHEQDHDVGCFVGVCASDYNDNVASHPPNAFSTLGTLRAFLTGKISHFFGFTGPSITFDTACSSSAVAIDTACKSILCGDCTSAIAGGVSIFTSPHFYQNLAAASFLSPTGATKSFDADADGYCRGEGVGLVVLKSLAKAKADGDNILGIILSSSVKQSSNKVPITVPYSPSQTELYRKVLNMANVSANDVSYLEAHGTGTPIGDPQEFEGIRDVFGSADRTTPLHFASVKGNIGHTEGASGVAGLIKTLLMMQNRAIPRQASYSRLNPKIDLSSRFRIPTRTVPWNAGPLVACVNNYGAAGSIAVKGLRENCDKLRHYISGLHPLPDTNALADIAFNLADKQNRSLPNMFVTAASSVSELDDQLRVAASKPEAQPCFLNPKPKPVILVFGGQTNRSVGLQESVYLGCAVLRDYLDKCNDILKGFGHEGIYPAIFQTAEVDDVVLLQTMQFALHYACAQAWIASGLQVDSVLGHSFGQLVALAVAGVFSLEDGLKLVYGRAVLMRDRWGSERGSMVALDADRETTMDLVASIQKIDPDSKLEIACYNGPRSHVLVGSASEIDLVAKVIQNSTAAKFKTLNVTHGFHSRFCDAIIPELRELAESLTYRTAKIPIETASDGKSWSAPTPELIADHTRTPVFFESAVKRIEARYGSCSWIESGSNSSVTSIVRRCLSTKEHLFCPANLSRDNALDALAETTVALWKNGHHVQFWPFHRSQREHYRPLNLPPYQFQKTRHWLDFDSEFANQNPVEAETKPSNSSAVPEPEPQLLNFQGFQDSSRQQANFVVDPRSDEWRKLVQGHAVLQQPLCPAPLYVELVLQAAKELAHAKGIASQLFARLERLEITSSLGLTRGQIIHLILTQSDQSARRWDFTFQILTRNCGSKDKTTTHAVGRVELVTTDQNSATSDFERIGRLLQHQVQNFDDVAARPATEAVRGSLVYKVFSRVVQYHEFYQGVRKVAGDKGMVVAEVTLPDPQPAVLSGLLSNPVAVDNFLQVPGLYANCLGPCPQDEVYVCTQVDQVQISPDIGVQSGICWKVCAISTQVTDKEIHNDVFAIDVATNKLVFVAFGARFSRVRITSLAKVLSRAKDGHTATSDLDRTDPINHPWAYQVQQALATPGDIKEPASVNNHPVQAPKTAPSGAPPKHVPKPELPHANPVTTPAPQSGTPGPSIESDVRNMLSRITDIPADQFKGEVSLADLGVDSLMATEIVSEVQEVFSISIPQTDMQDLQSFCALCEYLGRHLGRPMSDPRHAQVDPEPSPSLSSTSGAQDTALAITTKFQESDVRDGLVSRLASLLASHLECPASEFEPSTNLSDRGLDSLLCMELASDVEKTFGFTIDLAQLTTQSTFEDLSKIVLSAAVPGLAVSTASEGTSAPTPPSPKTPFEDSQPIDSLHNLPTSFAKRSDFTGAPRVFEQTKEEFGQLADAYQLTGFYEKVFPKNSRLVLAYTVEAFADLEIDLENLTTGERIPQLNALPKHHHLCDVLYEVLREGKVADYNGEFYVRSDQPIDKTPSNQLFQELVAEFPQHAKEHMLLDLCGSDLGKLISGAKDPLTVLFGSKKNRGILEDVYSTSPMYVIMSQLLTSFLEKALTAGSPGPGGKFRIIELGAGTGSTTKWVVDRLGRLGIAVEYTFTDISASLVREGKRKFAKYDCMKYATINIEKEPPAEYHGQFDIVLSTNCIHATRNLRNSLSNIEKLLNPSGFVALVEFTSRMYWFDLVFGLLEGWWLFDDGRPYVLANPEFWEKSMRSSGFNHVSWTGGFTRESEIVRVIAGFKQPVPNPEQCRSMPQEKHGEVETVVIKHAENNLPLRADIYTPTPTQASLHKSWAVGLMIHGGGHVMLSRKDVRPRQTQLLLDHGVLPVSIDYRLCPEVTILEGPLVDVSDGYDWACNKLPSLHLKRTNITIEPSKVVVIGWSTGGTLAMSLAWTSVPRGLPPPEAILVFYCPTYYEDPFWQTSNIPDHSGIYSHDTFNVLDGVFPSPITSYNIPTDLMATGGWMTPKDARSRIILHMNWHGQTLPVLFRGLPSSDKVDPSEAGRSFRMEQPSVELVRQASPYAQIIRGHYKSPTHIVFGTKDDLIPWQQAQQTADALREAGVESGITLLPLLLPFGYGWVRLGNGLWYYVGSRRNQDYVLLCVEARAAQLQKEWGLVTSASNKQHISHL
ncbi:hypothetical protein GE09DRAFT_1200074 [Coniochaeta sp. 2T2.1]|nr:hypothetical protein GE09DRAFT_1200074 [Coniochaeta sp. 2T2.1]